MIANDKTAIQRSNAFAGGTKPQVWMVSFADLMAILLTFMVISFSTRQVDDLPWGDMNRSLQDVFALGTSAHETPKHSAAVPGVVAFASDKVIAELVTGSFPGLAEAGGISVTQKGVEIDINLASNQQRLVNYLAALGRPMQIHVEEPAPDEMARSVQLTLAWERALARAQELRLQLGERGFDQDTVGALHVQVALTRAPRRSRIIVVPHTGEQS